METNTKQTQMSRTDTAVYGTLSGRIPFSYSVLRWHQARNVTRQQSKLILTFVLHAQHNLTRYCVAQKEINLS